MKVALLKRNLALHTETAKSFLWVRPTHQQFLPVEMQIHLTGESLELECSWRGCLHLRNNSLDKQFPGVRTQKLEQLWSKVESIYAQTAAELGFAVLMVFVFHSWKTQDGWESWNLMSWFQRSTEVIQCQGCSFPCYLFVVALIHLTQARIILEEEPQLKKYPN